MWFYVRCKFIYIIPYFPVIGSLKIPKFGVEYVKIAKHTNIIIKITTAILLLHLNLFFTSLYAIYSPNKYSNEE